MSTEMGLQRTDSGIVVVAPVREDPTKIHVVMREEGPNPATYPYSGVARHGNTRFNTTLISQIQGNLWQGGCIQGLVLPSEFKHLISLYKWERYTIKHDLSSFLEVTMYDSTDQGYGQVVEIARWVNACRKDGQTLVHCQAGLNRSSLVAATALVLDGTQPEDAIQLLRDNRSPACLCNPAFENWLLKDLWDLL